LHSRIDTTRGVHNNFRYLNSFTSGGKHMKSLLLSAAAMTVFLSACGKEPAPPAPAPAQPAPQAAPAPAPAAPASAMSDEDKTKAMEAAKAAAASAGKRE
jgi:hypothetical protein